MIITNMHATPISSSSSTTITVQQHYSLLKFTIITTLILFATQTTPSSSSSSASSSSLEAFVYVGCSQQRYSPNTPYESNLNSILTSLVNSATSSTYNTFKISSPDGATTLYGLYQCRGDLTPSACGSCTAAAVAQIGRFCVGTSGGALQLLGCYVRYDSSPFLGVQDETVAASRCGPGRSVGDDSATRRDAVLDYLTAGGGGQYFRVGGLGRVQGMVQCVRDLSVGQCQECLGEATRRLKGDCEGSSWGDVFLGKCYARWYYDSAEGNGYFSADGVRTKVNYFSVEKVVYGSFLVLGIYFLLLIS